MLEQQKRFRAEEDRKAREALAVYSQRKELQRIEHGIEDDGEPEEKERMLLYRKRKELEADSGQKRNPKMVNLEDYTLQEIDNDMDL